METGSATAVVVIVYSGEEACERESAQRGAMDRTRLTREGIWMGPLCWVGAANRLSNLVGWPFHASDRRSFRGPQDRRTGSSHDCAPYACRLRRPGSLRHLVSNGRSPRRQCPRFWPLSGTTRVRALTSDLRRGRDRSNDARQDSNLRLAPRRDAALTTELRAPLHRNVDRGGYSPHARCVLHSIGRVGRNGRQHRIPDTCTARRESLPCRALSGCQKRGRFG